MNLKSVNKTDCTDVIVQQVLHGNLRQLLALLEFILSLSQFLVHHSGRW